MPFLIRVYKQNFNFAAAHFMVFDNGTREPLHGHNYRVEVTGEAEHLRDDMVFDFLHIKPIIRSICQKLDHRFLYPLHHPHLLVQHSGDYTQFYLNQSLIMTVQTEDTLGLPIENTSVERLALYFKVEIERLIKEQYNFTFSQLWVEVEETPGQSARVGGEKGPS